LSDILKIIDDFDVCADLELKQMLKKISMTKLYIISKIKESRKSENTREFNAVGFFREIQGSLLQGRVADFA